MTDSFVSLGRLRPRLRELAGRYRYAVSTLDQMALSVFGFGLNLCLVRALSATDYGIVALWMSMAILAIGVQNALVNTPLSVYLPAAPDEAAAKRLEAAIGIVNHAAIAMTALVVGAVVFCVHAEWAPTETLAALAIPVFMAAGMYREYYRSIAFSRHDMAMLLWTDGPYLAVTTLCLFAMLAWPQRLASLAVAFFAMALGCLVSQICVRVRFDFARLNPFRPGWLLEYRRIAGEVTWSLIGVAATHVHGRAYVYVAVNMVGLAALAAINVVGVLFRPVRTMLNAWGRAALPNMAALLAAKRVAAFDRVLWQGFAAATAASVAWYVVLCLAWAPIERHFLGDKYPEAWSLMLPWAVSAGLSAMEYTVGIALQAAREFKYLAYTTLVGGPLTVVAAVGAVWWHDYTWTMYGLAFGSIAIMAMEAARLYVVRRRILAETV